MEDIIYYFHWVLSFLIGSTIFFLRKPSVFHPHVLFVIIIFVFFFSDFLVRGYDDVNCQEIGISKFNQYQLYLVPFYIISVAFSFLYSQRREINFSIIKDFNSLSKSIKGKLFFVAISILLADMYKRLLYSDFSFSQAAINSFLPYGLSPWNSSNSTNRFLGDEKFIFNIVRTALPVSGVFFSVLAIENKSLLLRLISLILFFLTLLLLLGEGSRTPIVGTICFAGIIYFYKAKSTLKKVAIISIGIVTVALFTSLAVKYRSYGLYDVLLTNKFDDIEERNSSLTYHQDDNYYQLIRVMAYSDDGVPHWDGLLFFTVIAVNPIPRYFWSGKPYILQDFYGKYKEEWITISYIGEFIAIFGNIFGLLIAIVVSMILIVLLNKFSYSLYHHSGLILYCTLILYIYMVFRSFLNVSQFVYLPLIAYLAKSYINLNFVLKSKNLN